MGTAIGLRTNYQSWQSNVFCRERVATQYFAVLSRCDAIT